MLFLFQGYYPQEIEPTPPTPTPVAATSNYGGYYYPEARRKLLYIYKPEDLEYLTEEEIVALWAFTEML